METAENRACPGDICPCDRVCPLGKAVSILGGRWKLRILCALNVDGTQRYTDLLKKTSGVTSAMLASSLREMEADGLITRTQFEQIPPRVEYALTERGRELFPILHRLAHWAVGEPFEEDDDPRPRPEPTRNQEG